MNCWGAVMVIVMGWDGMGWDGGNSGNGALGTPLNGRRGKLEEEEEEEKHATRKQMDANSRDEHVMVTSGDRDEVYSSRCDNVKISNVKCEIRNVKYESMKI